MSTFSTQYCVWELVKNHKTSIYSIYLDLPPHWRAFSPKIWKKYVFVIEDLISKLNLGDFDRKWQMFLVTV